MIQQHTKDAIAALLAVDKMATTEERNAVARVLSGLPDVLSVAEVCKRLGKTRQTIRNLIVRGLLTPVKGAGHAGYNRGVTAKSVEDYLNSLTMRICE